MKGELNKPGKSALRKESLDHGAFSLEEGTRERLADIFGAGAIYGSQLNGETIPFEITAGVTAGTIDVGSGTAVAPISHAAYQSLSATDPIFGAVDIETAGERIAIPLADVLPTGPIWSRIASSGGDGTGTGPFKESSDGLGGFVYTPESTGARSIPLNLGDGTYRIWLSYIPAMDVSEYSIHPLTGATIYTKKTDGYEIFFSLSDTKPGAPDERYMKIGHVTVSAGVVTAIDQSMMSYAKIRAQRVGIQPDSANRPASYVDGGAPMFLDDHVNAIGSGVVSPTNPHGVNLSDSTDYRLRGQDHMRATHSDGIMASGNALQCAAYSGFPGFTGIGVAVTQLSSGQYVAVDGVLGETVYPNVDILSGNVGYVYFTGADIDGNYYILLETDSEGLVLVRKYLISAPLPAKHEKLAEFSWTSATNTLVLIQDLRDFKVGFVGASNIRTGAIVSSKLPAADAGTSQDITTGNGVKTSHIVDQAITTAKLATGAVTKDKIQMGSIPYPIRWCVQGEVMSAEKVVQVLADADLKITRVDIYEDTMSQYGELTVDVKINGTSIFSTAPKILQATQPNADSGVRIYTTTAPGAAFTNTPLTTVSYGQIDSNANQAYRGDRISLSVTQTAVAGDGGGNDLLVSLSTE